MGSPRASCWPGSFRGFRRSSSRSASQVIALQPPGAEDLVITLFGTNDKTALNVAVVVVALLVAAAAGILGRRSFGLAAQLLVGFGFVAFAAAALQPLNSPVLAAVNAAVATAASIATLRVLLADAGFLAPLSLGPPGSDRAGGPVAAGDATSLLVPDWNRRRFLIRSGGFLVGAVALGAFGRGLLDRQHPAGVPVSANLPAPADTAPPLTADESLAAPGITPIVIPNDSFYRIDTELLVPQVDASTWQLRVTGMVDHPLTFTYPELLALGLFEQYVTLACVSNTVGGDLIGNTLWTGVHLKEVLARAGVQAGATQIVGRSVDGFTVGFPTSWALDPSREPMIAVGMNRRAAARGARLSRPPHRARPVRLRVGHQVAVRDRADHPRGVRRVLGPPGLGEGRTDPDRVAHRPPVRRREPGGRTGRHRRPRLGAGPRGREGRGPRRQRAVAGCPAQPRHLQGDLGAVDGALAGDAGAHTIEVRATDGTGASADRRCRSCPRRRGATGYDQVQVSVT